MARKLEKECPWQLLRCRNKVVQGTWEEEGAFQVSLRDRALPEDPLHLPLFSDILPYHCVPHIGVYSPEDYSIALPLAVITLPVSGLSTYTGLFSVLPQDLQRTLRDGPPLPPSLMEAVIIIHSRPCLESSLQPEAREVNLMLHTWAFQGLDLASCVSGEESPHATVEVGVFGGEGVRETAQDVCEELNGVAVGRTGPRILYMHDMSFSPHNAQLCLLHNSSLHAFFSLAQHPARGLVLAYHVLPSCEDTESRVKRALREAETVEDILANFELLITTLSSMKAIVSTLHNLIIA